jgi:hypothetical protein
MVDKQLACERAFQGARTRRRRKGPREPRDPVPSALTDPTRTHVCVSGEVNAWPYGAPERDAKDYRDEVVVWVAERIETGERFSAVATPTFPLAIGTPLHAKISRERIEGASRRELARGWAEFLAPTDVVCTWGHHAAGLFLAEGNALPEARVDLRAVSRLVARGKVGTIEAHGASLGLTHERAIPGFGRAARRLELLCGIARRLRGDA